ncbi:MAG: FAD-dependent oxidoreductase [Gammaproteobacteria bacterium]|nr:FAD-dependent oxidoreductase [Gammaproteobacteria bacterium]MBU0786879.1 FAD-dependent oxidoreductase [Gammaproteobacteria bacterium]MBU0813915.1 FAD-dependent oxidoreductase [Gammaproteobacteria bacterium]MBU1788612.1 FAD-dependent oxidoreductase [Gammaproteobacteria bacterium]
MKRLVLVGGGHAHLSVLQAFANRRPTGVELVLITPSAYQNYSGMLPGWISGHYMQKDCRIDLAHLVAASGAQLVLDHVVGMDPVKRIVHLSGGQHMKYDWLSLDVGSETNTSGLEGLGAKLLPAKPLDNFFSAWPQVLAEARASKAYRLVVVGAGAAGVEIALAVRYAFQRMGVEGAVDLVASESGMLQGHSKRVQDRIRRFAERAGLGLHFQRGVGVSDGLMLADGHLLRANRVIAATGARPAEWLRLSGLALDADGYVRVDQHHCSVSHPRVFAAGDVCARQDVRMERSGVHAVHAGPVLADNLLAMLAGGSLRPYTPKRSSLYLMACGPRYAVASWGQWSAEGSWVWRWKDWIDRGFIRRFSLSRAISR